MKSNIIVSSLIAIGIAFVSLQPASADSFRDMQRQLLNLQGGSAGNYLTISNNMRVGISNASNQIQSKVSSGQMSSYQASALQSQLQNIDAMTAQMGSDRVFTTSEVQQLLSNLQNVNSQIESASSTFNPYLGANLGGYNPNFTNYNAVSAYQQQLYNQINSSGVPQAQRQAWLNEYKGFSPYINKRQLTGNYASNQHVRDMIRLQERIRDQQRLAERDHHDWNNHNDNNHNDNNHNDNNHNDRNRNNHWH